MEPSLTKPCLLPQPDRQSPPPIVAGNCRLTRKNVETVRNNYPIKKLGLPNSPDLMAAINTYGRSNRNKYRTVVNYMLATRFSKESVYG